MIPEHWHTSAERMVLVAGELSVSYKGQAKVVLKPGMYAYGPAKLPHSAACVGSSTCVLFIAFESPVDAVPVAAAAK
jgi:quercetin dioxygenase-like cupin family protein